MIFRLLILIILVTLPASCRKRESGISQGLSPSEVFSLAQEPSPATNAPGGKFPIAIYLDDSESMRGFITNESSLYLKTIDVILDEIFAAKYSFSFRRLSDPGSALPHQNISSIKRWDFYVKGTTPLATLIKGVAGKKEITVIVTDLVQSESGTDSYTLAEALRSVAKPENDLHLLAFRSDFRGTYWIERSPKGTIDINPKEGRPFYLLILSPDRESWLGFEQAVVSHLHPLFTYSPTDLPLAVEEVKPKNPFKGKTGWFTRGEDTYDRFGSALRFLKHYTPVNPPKAAGRMPLNYSLILKNPSAAAIPITADVRHWRKETTDFSEVELSLTEQQSVFTAASPAEGALDVELSFPYQKNQKSQIYQVQLRPRASMIALPDWVNKWSTDDDRTQVNAGKTYKLDLFIKALSRQITENIPFFNHFIVLESGRR